MIYLASPYSHLNWKVAQHRFEQVEKHVAWALNRRMAMYSPIVYCHELARKYDLPKDAAFWEEFNHHMLFVAEEFHILNIEGWQDSIGVLHEVRYWTRMKPSNRISVGTLCHYEYEAMMPEHLLEQLEIRHASRNPAGAVLGRRASE